MHLRNFFPSHLKKKVAVLCILCFSVFLWQYSQLRSTSISYLDRYGKEQILTLPVRDKKRLYSMMRILFAENQFLYTLLGSKPVSWEFYHSLQPLQLSIFDGPWESHCRAMDLGWKTWLKYCHLFPLSCLRAEKSKEYPGGISILMINEQNFINVVNQYQQDFQNVLNLEIVDGATMLKNITHHSLMEEVLQSHQALIGMVLGFGKENSWAFLKSCETMIPVGDVWGDHDWQTEAMKKCHYPMTTEELLAIISCPSFAGYPNSEESLRLKKEYLETRQRVLEYYKNKDFLEASLSLLAGFRPS